MAESSENNADVGTCCELTDLHTRQPLSMFLKIQPKRYERLTGDHYFLFPEYLIGFALRHKQRSIFHDKHTWETF